MPLRDPLGPPGSAYGRGGCGVTFSDRPSSNQWSPLKHRGAVLAEVWFKPDGDPLGLVFRVPRNPDDSPPLTLDALLKAVAVPAEAVESWRTGEAAEDDGIGTRPDRKRPLPPPPPDAPHLLIRVRLNPPPAAAPPGRPGGRTSRRRSGRTSTPAGRPFWPWRRGSRRPS